MKSFIRSLLITSGVVTNIYTISLIHDQVNMFFGLYLVISNTLALTIAVLLREVWGWDNPDRRFANLGSGEQK